MRSLLAGLTVMALLAAGCSAPIMQPTPPVPVTQTDSPVVYFEIDTVANTIRPLGPHSESDIGQQNIYRAGNGFTFSESIKEQVDGVYTVQFTITNATPQDMGVDGEITVTFVNFQARDAAGTAVPGGGIVNASGFQAQTFFPYISITDTQNLMGDNPLPIEPATSFKFNMAIQVPQSATRAVVGLMLRAAQQFNTVPVAPNNQVTPAFGLFGASGARQGPEHATRFNAPSSMTICPGSFTLYLADLNGLWSLNRHTSKFLTKHAAFKSGSQIHCTEEGLFMTTPEDHRVYRVPTNPGGVPQVIAGTGTASSTDGPGLTATLNNPGGLSGEGSTLVVVEGAKIRLLEKAVDSTFNLSTRYTHNLGGVDAAVIDERGVIYFTSDTGLWRLDVGASVPVRIVQKDFTTMDTRLLRHPSGYLVVSVRFGHKVMAYLPSSSDPTQPWREIPIAGNFTNNPPANFAAGPAASIAHPDSMAMDASGTLFVGSGRNHNVLRVDRMR